MKARGKQIAAFIGLLQVLHAKTSFGCTSLKVFFSMQFKPEFGAASGVESFGTSPHLVLKPGYPNAIQHKGAHHGHWQQLVF
jgi:hypothetical protein